MVTIVVAAASRSHARRPPGAPRRALARVRGRAPARDMIRCDVTHGMPAPGGLSPLAIALLVVLEATLRRRSCSIILSAGMQPRLRRGVVRIVVRIVVVRILFRIAIATAKG